MSDLLAATGWIGEHPMTGADVAHRATMLDSGGAAEIAAIARAWGLVDVTGLVEMPQTGLTVDLARHVLIAPGIEARFDGRAGWDRAARRQGFVVVTAADKLCPGCARWAQALWRNWSKNLPPGVLRYTKQCSKVIT